MVKRSSNSKASPEAPQPQQKRKQPPKARGVISGDNGSGQPSDDIPSTLSNQESSKSSNSIQDSASTHQQQLKDANHDNSHEEEGMPKVSIHDSDKSTPGHEEEKDHRLSAVKGKASKSSSSNKNEPANNKASDKKPPTPSTSVVKTSKPKKSLSSKDPTPPEINQEAAESSTDSDRDSHGFSKGSVPLSSEIQQMESQVRELLQVANGESTETQRHQRFQLLQNHDEEQELAEYLFSGDDLTASMRSQADEFEKEINSDLSDTDHDDKEAILLRDAIAWEEDLNKVWENYRRVTHRPSPDTRSISIARERDIKPLGTGEQTDETTVKQAYEDISKGGPIYTSWIDNASEHELAYSVRKMVYQERNMDRSVNYNHRYDWMHPLAPLRLQNEWIQDEICRLHTRLESLKFFNLTSVHSPQCLEQHSSGNGESGVTCIECDLNYRWKTRYSKMSKKFLAIIKRIEDLKRKQLQLNQTSPHPRCHWCGQSISGLDSKAMDKLLRYARVDVEGVGPLPSVYEYDHEQNPLCLHCAAEMSSLLKEKRRFQSFYELTAINMPRSCNNCGLRESIQFKPAVDRMGEICCTCHTRKEQSGLDPNAPAIEPCREQEFLDGILESMDQDAIHWDKVANSPKANPGFLYSAQGLNSQWIRSIKGPNTAAMMTYILLQRNHLTRRSQDWELYTCNARSPSQAALYFARYTALYKKRPMTYLYIRALEAWNIPELREDDWEDRSSGLQTFVQLRNRIRKSVLSKPKGADELSPSLSSESDSLQATAWHQDKWTPEEIEFARELSGVDAQTDPLIGPIPLRAIPTQKWASEKWIQRLEAVFEGYEALPYPIESLVDDEERVFETIYFQETFNVIFQYLLHVLPVRPIEGRKGRMNRVRSLVEVIIPEIIRQLESVTGKFLIMNEFFQLEPLDSRWKLLPDWARKNAQEAAKAVVLDEGFLRLYARSLIKVKESLKDPSSDEFKKKIEEVQETILRHGHSPRTTKDYAKVVSQWANESTSLKEQEDEDLPDHASFQMNEDLETWTERFPELALLRPNQFRELAGERPALTDEEDPDRRPFLDDLTAKEKAQVQLQGPAAAGTTRVYFEEMMYEDQRPMFTEREEELPTVEDDHPMPTGRFPVYLLPLEYQVHVFQAALSTETRTASVRLVRTERYKRQGDMMQGGGPVQVPKIINQSNTRGFYRESNRSAPDRQKNMTQGMDYYRGNQIYQVPELVFRSKDLELLDEDASGIEVWKMQNLREWYKKGYVKQDTVYKVISAKYKAPLNVLREDTPNHGENTESNDKTVANTQEQSGEDSSEQELMDPAEYHRLRIQRYLRRVNRQRLEEKDLRKKRRIFSRKELKNFQEAMAEEAIEEDGLEEFNHQLYLIRKRKRLNEETVLDQIADRRQELVQELDHNLDDQVAEAGLDEDTVMFLKKQLGAEQRALGLDEEESVVDQESSGSTRSRKTRNLMKFKTSRKWKVDVAKQLSSSDQAQDWVVEDYKPPN